MTTSRSFFYLCTLGVFCFISYNLVRMPVLSLFAESLGAGPERIGLIVSVSTITGVLLKLPSGALSDIYGRKMLLRIGVVAFGLPPFIYPFISDLNALTALRFVHGLATAIFAPSAWPPWPICIRNGAAQRWEPIRPAPNPVLCSARSWVAGWPTRQDFPRPS
jgi:DHA1 family multidrug resistance protein-like MFS transporter